MVTDNLGIAQGDGPISNGSSQAVLWRFKEEVQS